MFVWLPKFLGLKRRKGRVAEGLLGPTLTKGELESVRRRAQEERQRRGTAESRAEQRIADSLIRKATGKSPNPEIIELIPRTTAGLLKKAEEQRILAENANKDLEITRRTISATDWEISQRRKGSRRRDKTFRMLSDSGLELVRDFGRFSLLAVGRIARRATALAAAFERERERGADNSLTPTNIASIYSEIAPKIERIENNYRAGQEALRAKGINVDAMEEAFRDKIFIRFDKRGVIGLAELKAYIKQP